MKLMAKNAALKKDDAPMHGSPELHPAMGDRHQESETINLQSERKALYKRALAYAASWQV
jgi:hypothetical protein